jgi:hypothetical protein
MVYMFSRSAGLFTTEDPSKSSLPSFRCGTGSGGGPLREEVNENGREAPRNLNLSCVDRVMRVLNERTEIREEKRMSSVCLRHETRERVCLRGREDLRAACIVRVPGELRCRDLAPVGVWRAERAGGSCEVTSSRCWRVSLWVHTRRVQAPQTARLG